MVVQSFTRGDFIEGVRALIVDKDNAPRWRIGSYDAVDGGAVEALFAHWWQPGADPLHMLG